MSRPTVIDMFSGCGGLSKGFIDAGFKILLGVDFDDAALKTFEKNHEGAIAFKGDLFKDESLEHRKMMAVISYFIAWSKQCSISSQKRLYLKMCQVFCSKPVPVNLMIVKADYKQRKASKKEVAEFESEAV